MPLGDAITDGLGMTGGGGYRVEMFRLALESGMDFTFVGSQHNGPTHISGISFPNSHEGHLGATIQQIDLMIQKNTLLVDPNIILLHIGTNDMFQNPTGAAARLGVFMDNITARVPDALLVVSNIIPFPAVANAVNQYNSEIPHLVEQRRLRGKNVMFVDQFSGFPPSQMPDGVYPNAQGYARMGQIWFNAIYEHLVDLD